MRRLLTLSIAVCATACLLLVTSQPALSKPLKQQSCGKVKKSKKKQCKLNQKVHRKLNGLKLSGTRSEESGAFTVQVPFSVAYCSKKKVIINGRTIKHGWAIAKAKKTPAGIQALVTIGDGTKGGYEVTYFEGVRLDGNDWESGQVFGSNRALRNFVSAEASPARC